MSRDLRLTAAMSPRSATIRTTTERGRRPSPGDVATMQLDASKTKSFGWKAKWNSDEAVRVAANELFRELAGEGTASST